VPCGVPATNTKLRRRPPEDHKQMAQKYFQADLKKLENLRIARGWSREDLADKAIVSTRTLDSIMAGKQAVLSTFAKIAKALETPVNTIIHDFELPQKPEERRWTVTISISAPYDAYDETKELPEFLKKLLSRVGGDEIWGVKATAGSTKICCYLTDDQHAKLMSEYQAGTLGDLDIIDIQAKKSYNYIVIPALGLWNDLRMETSEPDSDTKDKGEAKTG
jgi:transcriptional regulator with XRE-family HTH domain